MNMGRPKIELTREQVIEAQEKYPTYTEQAKYLGVSEDTYRRERERLEREATGKRGVKFLTERDPRLEITKDLSDSSFLRECRNIYKKSRKTIGYNTVEIDLGDDDAGVKIDCDWHIGNEMTRIDRWSEDIILTKNTKRCFTVLNGDYTDNLDAIKKAGTYESIMSVPEAKSKVNNAVKLISEKILGVTQGCHDEWFFNQDSWDISQYLADHCQGYWLGFHGQINLIVGEQEYSIHVRHKYRRHSTDNLTWGMLYKHRLLKRPVDIMMSGHHHQPTIRIAHERGKKVYLVMGGSYKPYDRFIEQKDIYEGIVMMPGLLLKADRHQIVPYLDFREMVEEL